MSEINWNELKDKAHSNAVKHGFWEGRPSDKHFLCLVISELMEAVNAHRRNKFARVPANRKETIFDDRTFHHENKYFRENFEEYVKDTVEDELRKNVEIYSDAFGITKEMLMLFTLYKSGLEKI